MKCSTKVERITRITLRITRITRITLRITRITGITLRIMSAHAQWKGFPLEGIPIRISEDYTEDYTEGYTQDYVCTGPVEGFPVINHSTDRESFHWACADIILSVILVTLSVILRHNPQCNRDSL